MPTTDYQRERDQGRYYFNDVYNSFDFFLVVTSFATITLQQQAVTSTAVNPSLLRIVRAFRLFRVLRAVRLVRGARGLIIIGQVSSAHTPCTLA